MGHLGQGRHVQCLLLSWGLPAAAVFVVAVTPGTSALRAAKDRSPEVTLSTAGCDLAKLPRCEINCWSNLGGDRPC